MTAKHRSLCSACLALFLCASAPLLAGAQPASSAGQAALARPAVVTVEAVYPGASAQVVADTVVAPIEQQLNGMDKMLFLRSRCTNDGRCSLTVAFEQGIEPDRAQVLVQNRVTLALPVLPDVVKRGGVTVKRKPLDVLLLVSLSSPEGRFDDLYLSNYAVIQLKDELARVPGVSTVVIPGQADYSVRIWLDPEKLAAHRLTASDVVDALRNQNLQIGEKAPGKDQEGPLTLTALGRLVASEQFEAIILKVDPAGRQVRLKDVGHVALGQKQRPTHAHLNGRPVQLLEISPTPQARPRELRAALQDRVTKLRAHLPKGLRLDVAFDFTPNLEAPAQPTAPKYLLLDLELPAGASAERTSAVLSSCEALLKRVEGVQDVLALNENPFDAIRDRPCILLRLTAARDRKASREQLARTIRTQLAEEVRDAVVRLRMPFSPAPSPRWAYPIDLAIDGPKAEQVRVLAETLAERLSQDKRLTDVWASQESALQPQLYLDIQREQAQRLGVALGDVFATLEVYMGSQHFGGFNQFGRSWQILVQAGTESGKKVEDLKQLKVRNNKGKMVPITAFLTVREIKAAGALERLNGQPMVQVTANPAPGVALAQVRILCERLAQEVRQELKLPAAYRLTWLHEPPSAKGK